MEPDPRHTTVFFVGSGELRGGDEVDVLGEITAAEGDAYRGGMRSIETGETLYIAPDPRGTQRRLVTAAIVELVAAGCLLAGGVILAAIYFST